MSRCSEGRTFTESGNFIAEAADVAGNVATHTVFVNIDTVKPTIASVAFSTQFILQNTSVTATPNASDALSGIATKSCEKPNTTTTGTKSLTCMAVDKAGNGTQRSFSYTVQPFFIFSGVNTASSINGVAIASWGSGGLGVGSLNSVSVVARGEGTTTVAGLTSNPGSRAGFTTSNAFSFVNFEHGHSFREATITNCRLGGGSLAYWRNGGSWQLVADQTYDRSRSCLTIRLTDTTSPSIGDLTGGAFFGIKNTEDQILDLMALVDSFNLKKSSDKKLNHDLDKALTAARKGDMNGVCKELERFIKQVNQEAQKKVTSEEATQLVISGERIKTLLACP